MKRLLLILLVVVCLLTTFGCNKNTESFSAPTNFYYRRNSVLFYTVDAVITPEIRETVQCNENILDVVNLYLQGPASNELSSPFPSNLAALAIVQDEDVISIQLNDAIADLSGVTQTIAYSCLFKTLTDLTDCTVVEIQILSHSGSTVDTLTLSDENLYFIDSDLKSE